jgi:Zn-dependent oligopeptidase
MLNKAEILQLFTRYLYNEKHLPMATARRYRDAVAAGKKDPLAMAAFREFRERSPQIKALTNSDER